MSDFGTMQQRIARELNRSDQAEAIRDAIRTAIAHYERRRFFFNEASASLTTLAGQSAYGAGDLTDLGSLVAIDLVRLGDGANEELLRRVSLQQIEASLAAQPDLRARPSDYTYWAQNLQLWPVPDRGYTLRLTYAKRLAALTADSDSNAWMVEGEELIRQRAKALLWGDVFQNEARAAFHAAVADQIAIALAAEGTLRGATGRVTPAQF